MNDLEMGRWQENIRNLVIALSGYRDVDGSGCDSGDPLDLTLDEIRQGFVHIDDQFYDVIKQARPELLEAEDKTAVEVALDLLREALLPIPAVLLCPECYEQHIDAPEPENDWTNPPHKSHKCSNCLTVWRAADVPTTGVAHVSTRGSADNWPETGMAG